MRSRVPETDHGIQGQFAVEIYDQMQRRLRDHGWMENQEIIRCGITQGLALEIGPGPGYLGLEWLKNTQGTAIKGLDISPDMIVLAQRNARTYGLEKRAEYIQGDGTSLPFKDGAFDAVFTASSLHEWSNPKEIFHEAWRVLKTGGKLLVMDFRRDMFRLVKWGIWFIAKPKEIRAGMISSINAAYTPNEVRTLIHGTKLSSCEVTGSPMGLKVIGTK